VAAAVAHRGRRDHPATAEGSRQQAEEAVGTVGRTQNALNGMRLEMDRKIGAIREQYEGTLDRLQVDLERTVASLEAWASGNPDEFAAGRKSIEFVHGTVGFRTGQPKLKTARGFTWDKVAAKINALGMERFLRRRIEVDREAIIAQRDNLTAGAMLGMGVQIAQDETFYVEPKAEALEQGATVAA
jgi:phage host-nuclease inhibitor protein Gam